jgi:NodT family efflux transporter outer membrane factor (OMF) lipoprotein
MMLRSFVAACAAALLPACVVGPDYVKPEAPVTPLWREGQPWKAAEPRDALPRGTWWTIFGDPALNALAERAARANFDIAVADARYRQALAATRQARAALFPTVDVGFSATRSRAPGATATARSHELAFDAGWEPDLWGRVRRNVESGDSTAQSALAELESVRLSTVAALVQNYFLLRVADAQSRLLQETIGAYTKSLEMTQNRYKAGVAARSDVVQAETQLKSTQAQLADLSLTRAELEHAIAVLAGEAPAALAVPKREPMPATGTQGLATVVPIPVALPSELLERRPDIAVAERRMAAANAKIGVARAAFFPSLSLSGTYGWRSPNFLDLLSTPTRFWSLGLAAAQFLFDGGEREAVADQARAAYDAEVARYRGTVLAAFQEVEDNLAALRILEEELRLQEDAVRAARESVDIALNRYKAGTASFLEVIQVQTIALQNDRSLLTIRGRQLTAAVLLVKAVGGGWHASELAVPPPEKP